MVGLVQLLVVIITYKFTNRYDQMGVKVICFLYWLVQGKGIILDSNITSLECH